MATYTNGSSTNGQANGIHPKITLYTNHICPFAHRAHITLAELGLPFEEVIIDLDRPRDPWYLKINPRGLVPTIKFSNGILEDEIITESAIVAGFLADTRPSHLLPPSSDKGAPLFRARVAFFTDAWNSKCQSSMYPIMKAEGAEQEKLVSELLATIEKEVEPLLPDPSSASGPFFGGNEKLTMAEVIVAPFLLRLYTNSKDGELIPTSFKEGIDKLPRFGKWTQAVITNESVLGIWDEKNVLERTKARVAKMKESAK